MNASDLASVLNTHRATVARVVRQLMRDYPKFRPNRKGTSYDFDEKDCRFIMEHFADREIHASDPTTIRIHLLRSMNPQQESKFAQMLEILLERYLLRQIESEDIIRFLKGYLI